MSCNAEDATRCSEGVAELMSCEDSLKKPYRNPKNPPKETPSTLQKKTLSETP